MDKQTCGQGRIGRRLFLFTLESGAGRRLGGVRPDFLSALLVVGIDSQYSSTLQFDEDQTADCAPALFYFLISNFVARTVRCTES
jgi:hypothetical protein